MKKLTCKPTALLAALMLLMTGITAQGANDADTHYVDAAKNLTIINRAQTPSADSTKLARLDVDLYPQMSAQSARYGRYSTGLAILFRTDSPFISARWTTGHHATGNNMTAILQSGMDMYIKQDGKWIFAGVARPANGTSHKFDIVSNMDGTMHECMLYLPTFTAVTSLEIGVKPGSVIEAIPNPFNRRIVFVGSSITHGASASRPGLTYPARIGRALNAEVPN
ncbi:MAG: SGNH/GDSL hydrolase family protein, partial [Muribaculaceae bacterium]|nr:SGNH/GDSL hydrolase family protein [Muribaculaceae bacterium]